MSRVVKHRPDQCRGKHMDVRAAEEGEIDHLAKIWYDGWHEAHAQIVPAELIRLRSLESFRDRLQAAFPDVRVVGPCGEPVGFCIIKGNELYQLFVSARSRGSGVAAALIADAETRFLKTASLPLGSHAPSGTCEPRNSMKNADGIGPGRSSTNWKPRRGSFRWKSGVIKNP